MSVASSGSAKLARGRLSSQKSNELVGLVLALLAVLLFSCLVAYHPQDPSLFHRTPAGSRTQNLVGPLGAEIAALCLAFMGLPSLVLPVLLALAAWRRLRRRPVQRVVGRGFGSGVVLVTLPALFHLTLGKISWRGEALDSGGFLGLFLSESLESRLNFMGTLLVLLGAMAVGSALIAQSTLGELLVRWNLRMREWWGRWVLLYLRRRERRNKDRARQRVVEKHLQRAGLGPRGVAPGAVAGGLQAGVLEGAGPRDQRAPVRVVERKGEADYNLRRVSTPYGTGTAPEDSPEEASSATVSRRSKPSTAQISLPFPDTPKPGELPPVNLLKLDQESHSLEENALVRLGDLICQRCNEFGVRGTVAAISPGPVITVFEFQPAPGVKVSQIVNLQDDLALALKAEAIRIDRLAGRSTLGIEVPNTRRLTIRLGRLLAEDGFRQSPSQLTMAIGRDLHGQPYFADLATMPHLLVAGATGSGKSVGLQSMLTSILYKATRDQVQFILIDPKRIELGVYADIPHLKTEVVVEPKKAANALRWAVSEMERRYRLLAEVHVRSIAYYNRAIADPEVQRRLSLKEEDESELTDLTPLPYYVVVIDELADLMMVASSEVETSIARLAQMARAVGIHLIVATQRPSVDVLTGTIKANFPCRISYATATRHDSRTILDQVGAEKLLGRGDMLFMPPGSSRTLRLHGAYITEQETAAVVRWLKRQGKPNFDPAVLQAPEEERKGTHGGDAEDDLFEEAIQLAVAEGQASASFLQRRMRIGFSRAARLIDMMEQQGLLGPQQGSKPREVLVKPGEYPPPGDPS